MRRAGFFAIVLIGLALGLAACGGGGGKANQTKGPHSPTPAGKGTPFPTSSGSPATFPLEIISITPNPAKVGDQATLKFKSTPGASIGVQLLDGKGDIVARFLVIAVADGTASSVQALQGAAGTWHVAAIASSDAVHITSLKSTPAPGPNVATASFEVK